MVLLAQGWVQEAGYQVAPREQPHWAKLGETQEGVHCSSGQLAGLG